MAATVLGFFSPTDVLGLGGSFVPQSSTPNATLQRAAGILANGDEGIHKTYGAKTEHTIVYEHQSNTGFIVLPQVGSVVAGLHIDSVDVEYNTKGWPKVSIKCHQHGTNAHTSGNTLNLFTPTVKLPSQFGIPRALAEDVEVDPDDIFKLGNDDAAIGISSMKYSLACQHQDDDGEAGEHLAGENRDGVEKIEIGLTGIPASVTTGTDWDKLADGTGKSNTSADTQTISLEHHIARDAA